MAGTSTRVSALFAGVALTVAACGTGTRAPDPDQRTVVAPPECGVPADAELVGQTSVRAFQLAGEGEIARIAGASYREVNEKGYPWRVKVAMVLGEPALSFGVYDAAGRLADASTDFEQTTTHACLTYTVFDPTVEVRVGSGNLTDAANADVIRFSPPKTAGNPADARDLYRASSTSPVTQLPRR